MRVQRSGGYSIKTHSDNDYSLKTFVGGGYGDHGSYSSGGGDCCPLVVDPLTYAALIGFIGLATYFFREFIAMSMLMMARKRRRKRDFNFKSLLVWDILETLYEGKPIIASKTFSTNFDM